MHDINDFTPSVPKNRIWLFNSAGSFSGNVKFLFLYIVNYRPDIYACYISGEQSNVDYIRSLGYRACHFKSEEGKKLMRMAGVYVNEQAKEHYPAELCQAKLLNLYHGVGLKQIERKWDREFLALKMAKKYIQFNEHFYKNMCFLTTSPFMEKHFKEQLALEDSQIIRGGYPRCVYQNDYEPVRTFEHNILESQGLPSDTKIALFAPTYRESNPDNFLYKAIEDLDVLVDKLKSNNILLIIKLHPKIVNDLYFSKLKSISANNKHLLLWDNKCDIYEIFNKIDIGIVDYSSIYYDLLLAGVPSFIRYVFDVEEETKFLLYDYFENTSGIVCRTFDEFINAFDTVTQQKEDKDTQRIKERFWSYSDKNTCDSIVEQTLAFQPDDSLQLPTLYSFDIFDTLIARKVLQPRGVFYAVQDKICRSHEGFPEEFRMEYVAVRMQAEANVRERLYKSVGHFEISFDDIFARLAEIYPLPRESLELLKQWEIEAELENVIPVDDKVAFAEQLIRDGEQVVLISDMYLPKEVIQSMLRKISPMLAEIPLFLSSDRKVQKTTQLLYLDVYRYFTPYRFKEWHHYGDNKLADGDKAKAMGIIPHLHTPPSFNAFEQGIVNRYKNYDSYLLAGMLTRTRVEQKMSEKEYYAFAHIGALFVPYIAWAVRDAITRGMNTLYFISRDGYFLQKVADAYINHHKLPLKTKYIFGSRRVWRVPGMVDHVDEEFFSNFGNFVGVSNYEKLLDGLNMPHHIFQKMFPELDLKPGSPLASGELAALREYFKKSEKYNAYLLEKSSEEREVISRYFHQEIDFNEKIAFVEYWGRGYTQTSLSRLLDEANGNKMECICYYYRSILGSEDNIIRLNFTTNNTSIIFVEAIFANHPYNTVTAYTEEEGSIVPVMTRARFDAELFWAMEKYLPMVIEKFYSLPFMGKIETVEKLYSDVALYWYRDHQDDPVLVKTLGHLLDSVELWGEKREFAPAFTQAMLDAMKQGKSAGSMTRSVPMSLARSTPAIRAEYQKLSKATPAKPSSPKAISKQAQLIAKLERNPRAFFADSKSVALRNAGRVCLSPMLQASLGKALVGVVKFGLRRKVKK
ncbi:MAG: CDP-glycerol glycerophosphotransferase family protein [Mailhella sp.]|nr:CDP-glycerol glycerophosphotransferase family protein [Mailhella sp.]